ncbi:unnamed protein product [Peniophora sp. CBMAI 1063]|nr:unnamed protein product [Peniophora sp. CBMAI 1063]
MDVNRILNPAPAEHTPPFQRRPLNSPKPPVNPWLDPDSRRELRQSLHKSRSAQAGERNIERQGARAYKEAVRDLNLPPHAISVTNSYNTNGGPQRTQRSSTRFNPVDPTPAKNQGATRNAFALLPVDELPDEDESLPPYERPLAASPTLLAKAANSALDRVLARSDKNAREATGPRSSPITSHHVGEPTDPKPSDSGDGVGGATGNAAAGPPPGYTNPEQRQPGPMDEDDANEEEVEEEINEEEGEAEEEEDDPNASDFDEEEEHPEEDEAHNRGPPACIPRNDPDAPVIDFADPYAIQRRWGHDKDVNAWREFIQSNGENVFFVDVYDEQPTSSDNTVRSRTNKVIEGLAIARQGQDNIYNRLVVDPPTYGFHSYAVWGCRPDEVDWFVKHIAITANPEGDDPITFIVHPNKLLNKGRSLIGQLINADKRSTKSEILAHVRGIICGAIVIKEIIATSQDPDAKHQEIHNSISVRKVDCKKPNGEAAPVWNVAFRKFPTEEPAKQVLIRKALLGIPPAVWSSAIIGRVSFTTLHKCKRCWSLDHPDGLCPFPRHTLWRGPASREASRRADAEAEAEEEAVVAVAAAVVEVASLSNRPEFSPSTISRSGLSARYLLLDVDHPTA